MNEWGFTGEVKSWIDQIAKLNSNLPFAGARVEDVGKGSQKRRDLTLIDRNGEAIMTGEVKLPDAADGGSPYRPRWSKTRSRKHFVLASNFSSLGTSTSACSGKPRRLAPD
jgi:hypothetical protein